MRLGFFLSIIFILGLWDIWYPTAQADFFSRCYSTFKNYCGACAAFPLRSLLCLYGFLAYATLQALVQWRFLQGTSNPVSGWWAGAPALASLPLAFLLAGGPECNDCSSLRFTFSGVVPITADTFQAPVWVGLLAYLLLVGLIQSFAWQHKTARSWGWSLAPLGNSLSLLLSGGLLAAYYHSAAARNLFYSLPALLAFLAVFMVLLLACLLQDTVSAMYAGWTAKNDATQ